MIVGKRVTGTMASCEGAEDQSDVLTENDRKNICGIRFRVGENGVISGSLQITVNDTVLFFNPPGKVAAEK